MPSDSQERFTMKIDNIRLTDAAAQKKIEDAENKAQFEVDYADLVADLKALKAYASIKGINDKNYEAVKAEIEEVRAAVDALSPENQKIAEDVGFMNFLTQAEKTLVKYEEAVKEKTETMAANQALIDAINALTTDITVDNYEAVKAAVAAAKAEYEALKRSVQNYFKEDGLTAKLQAAEAAVNAFDPNAEQDDDNTGNTGADEGGCQSALTVGAVATMVLAGAWVTIAARKKEN
jgi:hypothetical protein